MSNFSENWQILNSVPGQTNKDNPKNFPVKFSVLVELQSSEGIKSRDSLVVKKISPWKIGWKKVDFGPTLDVHHWTLT